MASISKTSVKPSGAKMGGNAPPPPELEDKETEQAPTEETQEAELEAPSESDADRKARKEAKRQRKEQRNAEKKARLEAKSQEAQDAAETEEMEDDLDASANEGELDEEVDDSGPRQDSERDALKDDLPPVPQPGDKYPEEYEPPKEKIPEDKIDPGLKANKHGREAAEELISMAESEPDFKQRMNKRFWETLRDISLKHVQRPVNPPEPDEEIKPFDDAETRSFLKERMESGKFLDKAIVTVSKNREGIVYLRDFMTRPSRFQKRLQRWFARGEKNLFPDSKAKPPANKKKPEPPKAKPKKLAKPKKVKTAKLKPIKDEPKAKPKKSGKLSKKKKKKGKK